MTISLKRKLRRRDLLVGTVVTLPSPEISEILSLNGFDWLFVDAEHSPMGMRDAQALLQAAGPGRVEVTLPVMPPSPPRRSSATCR